MTEVIRGEFSYPFELDVGSINVSGVAVVVYVAERYSKSEGWSVEEISVDQMVVEEAYNDDGDETTVGQNDIALIADLIESQNGDGLVYRAIEDASERSFYG